MTLNLPLDFERLPEFWQLKETLRAAWWERVAAEGKTTDYGTTGLRDEESGNWHRDDARNPQAGTPTLQPMDAEIEDMAALLWVRLWIVLGYLARATNRPGWLN